MGSRGRRPSAGLVIGLLALFIALGGSALAATGMFSGAQIKKNSIPLDRLAGSARKALEKPGPRGTRGPAGGKGATGAKGATGPQGPVGAKGGPGPQGAVGPEGAQGPIGTSFEPGHVTPQTAQLFGFLPWRDTDPSSTIGFSADALTIDTEEGGAGVDLPIAPGTMLNRLGTIDYTSEVATTGTGVSLGIEIFGHDDSTKNGGEGTYTTLVYFPSNPGANSAFNGGDPRWRTTQAIGALTTSPTGKYTWDEIKAGLGPIYDTATTIAVHLQIGSTGDMTPSHGTVSELTLGYNNAADPVTYGFGTE